MRNIRNILLSIIIVCPVLGANAAVPDTQVNLIPLSKGAFVTGCYRNLFVELGYSKKQVDKAVYSLAGMAPRHSQCSAQQIAERCVMLMLNEAARCIDEGIVRSARDGDIGAVFGIGFPPFLGGPLRYMDTLGAGEVVARLQRLATQYGSRFTPCEALLQRAERELTFWPGHETVPLN